MPDPRLGPQDRAPLLAGAPLTPEEWRDLLARARRAGIPPGTRITAALARQLLTPEERPMGFHHSTYFAYGVHVNTPGHVWAEAEEHGKALGHHKEQCPDVGTLTAGGYDDDGLFLVTQSDEISLGEYAHVTPDTHPAEQLADWNRQLTAAADLLGIPADQLSAPGWFCVPDVS
jgi:hypothetical protein